MTNQTMTIRQIADVCEQGESSIRRWIDQASAKMASLSVKMADALKSKKPAQFSLDETLAIIRAGGKNTLADLLAQNAKTTAPKRAIPCGSQLEAFRKIYGPHEAAKRLDFLIGYPSGSYQTPTAAKPTPSFPALTTTAKRHLTLEAGLTAIHSIEKIIFSTEELPGLMGLTGDEVAEALVLLNWAPQAKWTKFEVVKIWKNYYAARENALNNLAHWRTTLPAKQVGELK